MTANSTNSATVSNDASISSNTSGASLLVTAKLSSPSAPAPRSHAHGYTSSYMWIRPRQYPHIDYAASSLFDGLVMWRVDMS